MTVPYKKRVDGRAIPGRKKALADKLRNHYARQLRLHQQDNPRVKASRYTQPRVPVVKPGPSAKAMERMQRRVGE